MKSFSKLLNKCDSHKYSLCVLSCVLATFGCFILMLTKRILRTFGAVTLDQILIHIAMPRELIPDDFFMRILASGWKSYIIIFILCIFCIVNVLVCNEVTSRYIFNFMQTALSILRLDKFLKFLYVRTRLILFVLSCLFFVISIFYCDKKMNIMKSLVSLRQTSKLIDDYSI